MLDFRREEGGVSVPPAATMDRRMFMMGTAMLAAAGVAAALLPSRKIDLLGQHKLENLIPERVGPWGFVSNSGLVVPPEDQLSQQLYAQLLTRTYSAEGLPTIMLLVTQGGGQTGVVQIHRPEVCYPASGFSLSKSRLINIPIGAGKLATNAFTATADARTEQLMYWTRVGYDLPRTWAEQRWSVAKANLEGYIPDAALIRVSTVMVDPEAAFAVIGQFVRALLASVSPATRTFLVGPLQASAAT